VSFGRERTPLFWSKDGLAVKGAQLKEACAEVARLPEDRILNTDPEALVKYFVEKYSVEVPKLDMENATATEHERNVEVWNHWDQRTVSAPGIAFDFEIPFSGEADVFKIRPSSFDTAPPYAEIRQNLVCFSVSGRELTQAQIKQEFESTAASINKYLGWHREFWADLPNSLSRDVRAEIDRRRERLLKQKGLAASLAGLGIKLKEKPGDARTYVPPALKQKLTLQLPPMRAATKPEPTLDKAQYDTIIRLIIGAGRSIEQSSSRARNLDEESLRDMLLVPLNAHFGTATGEAFNYTGKTDILIRHEGGNLFVAECKIWRGEKQLLEAISQLLGYLTWRDTKAVLVIFSRNVAFSEVVRQLISVPKTHPSFVSGPNKLDETSFQFAFSLPRDIERHVSLTLVGFDLGADEKQVLAAKQPIPRVR
jgi:hypothetical protein